MASYKNNHRGTSCWMKCLFNRNFIYFVFILVILIFAFTAWRQLSTSEDNDFASIPVFLQYSGLPHVTRVLHQIRTTPPMWQVSWQRCFPGWLCHNWKQTDSEQLIDLNYPWFRKTYNAVPSAQCRENMARYIILFHFGGIFATPNIECLRPFEFLLSNHSIVFGAAERDGSSVNESQTSFIYSRPRHTFWLDVIAEIYNQDYQKTKECSTSALLNQVLKNFIARDAPQESTIKVYPPEFFYPMSVKSIREDSACKSINTLNAKQLQLCKAFLNDTSYVINHTPLSP